MKEKKSVYVLYTGGTIGMKKTDAGYVPVPGFIEEQLSNMPELHDPLMPNYSVCEYHPIIDSVNMQPKDWIKMSQDILAHYQEYDGFLILHGTDTMAYTASALSFMLENLSKPIIITGSQVPITEIHSDARMNLLHALYLAGNYQIPEVCLFFNNQLLRGNRSQKINATSFSAFASPNYPVLAEVGVDFKIYTDRLLPIPEISTPQIYHMGNPLVASLRLFPNMPLAILEQILHHPVQGLILESYGIGNAPDNNPDFLRLLEKAVQEGIVIVNSTQCLHGNVDMSRYASGIALQNIGILSAYDMTPEAVLCKLSFLLSQNLAPDEIKKCMLSNLRGELTIPA